MTTDYDTARRQDLDDRDEDSLGRFRATHAEARSGSVDVDDTQLAELLELPGADLSSMSGAELTERVLPKQRDEFSCTSCFLLNHTSRLALRHGSQLVCRDCT